MTFLLKKKALKKLVSSLAMLTTVVSMSGLMAFSSVTLAAETIADGALIKSNATNDDGTPTYESLDVYIVKTVGEKNFKRLILNPTVFESYGHLNPDDIMEVDQATMDLYTTSALVRVDTDVDEKVYAMAPDDDAGAKSWVNLTTEEATSVTGYDADSVYTINEIDGGNYNTVGDVTTTTELTDFYADGSLPGVSPVPVDGALVVALSANTPSAANIPVNVQSVKYLQVNLTAGENDSTVSSITVERTGLGESVDFDKVWAQKNGIVISSKKSISSNDTAILTINPALEISAGETVTLDIVASMNGTSGHLNGLQITSASDLTSTGVISGSFPISGNIMSLVSYNVTKALFTNEDTSANTVKVGDEAAELGRFSVKADGSKDLVLKTVVFKQIGNATLADSLTDLFIEKSGVSATESATIDGKYITFTFADAGFVIEDGETETFRIKASIISQDASHNTVQLKLDNKEDLVAEEISTGFTASAVSTQFWNGTTTWTGSQTETGAADAYATLVKTTVDAGVVTVAKDSASPSATNYTEGSKDVVGLIANVKSDEAFTADSLRVSFDTKTLLVETENFKVYVNGILLDSVDPVTADASNGYLVIDSSFTVNAGDNEVKVVYDIKSTATDEELVTKLVGDANLFGTPEYISNGDAVGSSDISGTATGGTVSVKTASFTATRSDGFSAERLIIQGNSDVTLAKITLKAQNDDIIINNVELALNTGSGTNVLDTNVSDMKLFVGTTQIGAAKNFSAGSTFGLSSNELVILRNTTKVLELKGSFASAAVNNSTFKTVVSFEAEGSNSKSLTVTPTVATTQFKIAESGSIAVVIDGATPIASLVAANSSAVETSIFKLTATNDTINVNEIYLSNVAGTGADNRISLIELYNGSNLLDSDVPTNGEVHFIIPAGKLKIDKNTNSKLTVKVNLNQIEEAAQTGKDVQFAITKIKAKSSAGSDLTATYNPTIDFVALIPPLDASIILGTLPINKTDSSYTFDSTSDMAVGDVLKIDNEEMLVIDITGSTVSVTRGINGTDAAVHTVLTSPITHVIANKGNSFRIRKTVPTVAEVSLSDTILNAGDNTVAKFSVAANSNEDVTLKSVILTASATVNTVQVAVGSVKVGGTTYGAATVTPDQNNITGFAMTNITVVFTTPVTIAAGTSKTFEVILDVSTLTGQDNNLTTKIAQDGAFGTTGNFVWSDNANVLDYAATLGNGYLVAGLSTSTQTISN